MAAEAAALLWAAEPEWVVGQVVAAKAVGKRFAREGRWEGPSGAETPRLERSAKRSPPVAGSTRTAEGE